MAPIRRLRKTRALKKIGEIKEGKEMVMPEPANSLHSWQKTLSSTFGKSSDFRVIEGVINGNAGILFYLESMINKKQLVKTTSKLFVNNRNMQQFHTIHEFCSYAQEIFGGIKCETLNDEKTVSEAVLNGSIVIVIEGLFEAIAIKMSNTEKRALAEPSTQTVIRGPKDSFIEAISTNITLIRRRIKSSNLTFEKFTIGKDTQTFVYIGYMDGIVNQTVLKELKDRLNDIQVSAIFDSGNIEELITDKTFTFFPLALNTERPDSAAANIMDGKIVILVDGSPFALIVPAVFVNFFEISEDFYQPLYLGSFLRFIRYLSFMIALITPSVYVGVLTYHQELLPTSLLLSIIAQREGVPFPAVVEVLLMEITFEILREAGIRMPKAVGQMVSIVGALVIGQAAAEAGIISNIMIIIMAITAIANFVSPVYSFSSASRLIRFMLIISAACLGLYGVFLMLILMVAHLCSLRSFGIPYLSPLAPFILEDQKDVFIRFPYWAMSKRPKYMETEKDQKAKPIASPSPPPMKGD